MAEQLSSFLRKFCSLWQAGNDARLNLECHAGQARIHLQLNLHPPPPPQPHHQRPRCPGPSRLRSSARRAEARASAAKAAAPTAEIAVQTDDVDPHSHDEHTAHQVTAAQAGQKSAEQAQQWLPPKQVRDRFCPDQDYHTAGQAVPPPHHLASPSIPQLDGSMFVNTHEQVSLNVTSLEDQECSCKCCKYETFFSTEDMLKYHHDEEHDEFEECNICYTRHVWVARP